MQAQRPREEGVKYEMTFRIVDRGGMKGGWARWVMVDTVGITNLMIRGFIMLFQEIWS